VSERSPNVAWEGGGREKKRGGRKNRRDLHSRYRAAPVGHIPCNCKKKEKEGKKRSKDSQRWAEDDLRAPREGSGKHIALAVHTERRGYTGKTKEKKKRLEP